VPALKTVWPWRLAAAILRNVTIYQSTRCNSTEDLHLHYVLSSNYITVRWTLKYRNRHAAGVQNNCATRVNERSLRNAWCAAAWINVIGQIETNGNEISLFDQQKKKRSLNKSTKGKVFVLSATFRHNILCAMFVLFLLTLYHCFTFMCLRLTLDVKVCYKTRCCRTGRLWGVRVAFVRTQQEGLYLQTFDPFYLGVL
jgi:hypothetical protein